MALKISLLGAGSVVFAKTLLSDVLQFPELADATIALMDIDPGRLKIAKIMAERIAAKLGGKARIEATLDSREAIRDANYVIVTIQVGGYEPGTVLDFEIPRKYGLLQTIGDTLGVGGIFRGLRTIPVINAFAREIAEVGAPDCLLLNYTNPMAMNCWAVDRAVGIPHVGLCHSVQGTSQQLAGFAQLPMQDVSYLVAGINHMAFFLRFEYRRQDAYPLLFALLEDANFAAEKVRFEMMRRTGYFVTESSEHQSEYLPYFIHHGQAVIDRFDVPIDEYLRRCRSIMGTWKETEAALLGEDGEILLAPPSSEYGSYIIHSRETNTARVIYGNVPNRQLITNLPAGCCVEVPCLVDANGLQPTHIGDLPPQLAALCQTNINVQALTVEAALTGRREHIYHAVMLDPHTSATLPLDRIWSMCDELIEAHQQVGLLGKFQPTVPGTGRAFAGTADRLIARIEPATGTSIDENASELALQISVTNPGPTAVEVPLVVRCPGADLSVDGNTEYLITVAPRTTAIQPLKAHRNGANGQGGSQAAPTLELSSPLARVFARGYTWQPRLMLKVGADAKAAFELTLAGFPAAKGTIELRAGELAFTFEINDSKVESTPEHAPWKHSCVELFFSSESSQGIRHIFLLPLTEVSGQVLITGFDLKPLPEARGSYQLQAAGYTLEAVLPLPVAGLEPDIATFLFDVIIDLTALGEAHSGGRAALNGALDSAVRTDHFARVNVGS